jgi:hypothetical protein
MAIAQQGSAGQNNFLNYALKKLLGSIATDVHDSLKMTKGYLLRECFIYGRVLKNL